MVHRNDRTDRSVPDVLQDIAGNLEDIARSEFLLAKTEIKEEAAETINASRMFGAGIVFVLYALGFLLLAAVYALATVLAVWLAALVVSAVAGGIALVLITKGKAKLKDHSAQFEKTVSSSLKKGRAEWARTQSRSEDISRNDAIVSTTTSVN